MHRPATCYIIFILSQGMSVFFVVSASEARSPRKQGPLPQKPSSIRHPHYPEWTPSDPYPPLYHDETAQRGIFCVLCGDWRVWGGGGQGFQSWRQMSMLPLSTHLVAPTSPNTNMEICCTAAVATHAAKHCLYTHVHTSTHAVSRHLANFKHVLPKLGLKLLLRVWLKERVAWP